MAQRLPADRDRAAGAEPEPGKLLRGPKPDPQVAPPPLALSGATVRAEYTHPNSDFEQPRALYERVMSDTDRAHLVHNIVQHLGNAKPFLQLRQAAIFHKVHPEYGSRVAEGLGLDVDEVKRLAELEPAQLAEATAAH